MKELHVLADKFSGAKLTITLPETQYKDFCKEFLAEPEFFGTIVDKITYLKIG